MESGSIAQLAAGFLAVGEGDLDALVRADELTVRAAQAERSIRLAVIENRQIHLRDGHRSMQAYLRATTNWSDAEARRQIRLARLVDRCPTVGDALLAGHIGVAQATLLAATFANRRVRRLLSPALPALLDHAEHLAYADFKICVDRWVMLADLDGAFDDHEANVANRTARVTPVGSIVDIQASGGDALLASKLVEIFERFVRAEFEKDLAARRSEHGEGAPGQPLPRTDAQRRFDALEAIFDAAVAAGPGGRLPDPVINIVIDAATLSDTFAGAALMLPSGDQIDVDDFEPHHVVELTERLTADPAGLVDRRCETRSGVPVHPMLVLQAAMTAHVRRVVIDSEGVVVDQGRLQRLFVGNTRLAASLLARRCAHLGCNVPAERCDVDHMDEFDRHRGGTDQHNAAIKCGGHNRHKHRERWRSRRSASGRVYDIRPDDSIVLPVGERPPDLTADEARRLVRARLDASLVRSTHGRPGST